MTEREETIDFPHSIESDSDLAAADERSETDFESPAAGSRESVSDQPYEHPERKLASQRLEDSLSSWRRAGRIIEYIKSEVGNSVSEQSASDVKLEFLGRLRAAKEAEVEARKTIEANLDYLQELDAIERYVNQERQKPSANPDQVDISPPTNWPPEALN